MNEQTLQYKTAAALARATTKHQARTYLLLGNVLQTFKFPELSVTKISHNFFLPSTNTGRE
jgi:hypothetical protein